MRKRHRRRSYRRSMYAGLAVAALAYWYINRQMKQAQLTPEQIAYAKSLPSDLYL